MNESLAEFMSMINNPPDNIKYVNDTAVYKKRVFESSSGRSEKVKSLLILFLLAESGGLPVPFGLLKEIKNKLFKGVHIEGVYHTGYEFDSSELRPVFSIGTNVFSYWRNHQNIYLPLAHNYAIGFSVANHDFYNSSIKNPSILKLKSGEKLSVYQVLHDYIDGITSIVALGSVNMVNTIYTPFELKNI
jgi:hypothetical protein